MRNFRKAMAIFTVASGFLYNSAAEASPAPIVYLHAWSGGFSFVLKNSPYPCSAGNQQYYVNWSTPNSDKMYSLVLAAYESGDWINVVSFQCANDFVTGGADVTDLDSRHANTNY